MGAAKDGGPSSTGHPDDTDELHISIEGTNDAVDKCVREIEKFLYNPAEAQRLKQEQLRQLADMNNALTANSSVEVVYSGGSEDNHTLEILVPNNMVGLVIGKGGDNILRIQSQLNVQSHIAKESEMKPGETMRSIVLKGEINNVKEARKRIEEIVANRVAALRGNSNQKNEMDHAYIVQLPVLNDKVGIVIGKGGATIKGIQERTRTTVKIPHGPDEDNPQVRTVLIGGDTKEAVDACQMEIFLALQMQQQSAQMAYNSIASALNVPIPDEKTAIVIGKGGCNVKDIQSRLNVKIQIPQGADIGSNPPVRTISIVGTPEMQALAKYEIELLAAGTSLHAIRANSASYSTGGVPAAGSFDYSDPNALYYATYGAAYDPALYAAQTAALAAAGVDPTLAAAAAAAAAQQTATTEEVPTDPTSYYNDYWYYASFYGEAAARVYYGAWSPPEGTKPPEGMVIPADPTVAATTDATQAPTTTTAASQETSQPAAESKAAEGEASKPSGDSNAAATSTETKTDADATAQWEAYRKQVSYKDSSFLSVFLISIPFFSVRGMV